MATIKSCTDVEQNKDLPIFDGFDYLGNPTGIKCMMCLYQHIKCKHQGFFGEGAFLICKKYDEHSEFKCDKI